MDLIDREELLKHLITIRDEGEFDILEFGVSESQIRSMPRVEKRADAYWYSAIDPQKHLNYDKNGFAPFNCACSNCQEWLTGSDELPVFGRFCPNCGARMEPPKEET